MKKGEKKPTDKVFKKKAIQRWSSCFKPSRFLNQVFIVRPSDLVFGGGVGGDRGGGGGSGDDRPKNDEKVRLQRSRFPGPISI